MTDSNTVEISGIEFDIDHLETAIEEVQDENGNAKGTVRVNEEVTVVGDSYTDADVTIARTEDVVHIDSQSGNLGVREGADKKFINISRIETYIEEAREVPFIEYLEEEVDYLHNANEIEEVSSADARIVHKTDDVPKFLGREVRALVEDENVAVEHIEVGGEDEIYAQVSDQR